MVLVFTEEKQKEFLDRYSRNLSITLSAEAVGVSKSTVFNHLEKNAILKSKLNAIKSDITEQLSKHIIELALNGNSRILNKLLDSKLFKDSEFARDTDITPSLDVNNLKLVLTNKTYEPVKPDDYEEGDDDL